MSAQESDMLKIMMKETIKPDLLLDFSHDFSDSIIQKKIILLDATKEYMPRIGFNHKINQILLYDRKDNLLEKSHTISINLMAVYNNQKKFDPNSTETVGDVVANYALAPVASIIMINPLEFFNFLMRAGVLPKDPFVPKQSRKERMLKTIKEIYKIED